MEFEWDADKNRANIRKHGIDFEDVCVVFDGPMLVALDNREDYGEERWIGMGMMRNNVIVVIYTERKGDVIRIISARKATKSERGRYHEKI